MTLTKEQIDRIFEEGKSQADICIALYAAVVPNWENVAQMNGFPRAGKTIDLYLFSKFIHYDRVHCPDVVAGGLWLNNGFSVDEGLGDWEVITDMESVEYKE
jgi:hypothetical protein